MLLNEDSVSINDEKVVQNRVNDLQQIWNETRTSFFGNLMAVDSDT